MKRTTRPVVDTEADSRLAVLIQEKQGRTRELRTFRVPVGTPEQMIKGACRALYPDFFPQSFHLTIGFHDVRFGLRVSFGRDRGGEHWIEIILKVEDRPALIRHLAPFVSGLTSLSGKFPDSYDDDEGDGGEELPVPSAADHDDLEALDVPGTLH